MNPVHGPGSRLGIMGGGQLGRMLALAARRLGYGVHVFAPGRRGGGRRL
jgi:5-(carboxyamino)imidazole ribonucleotide synthase